MKGTEYYNQVTAEVRKAVEDLREIDTKMKAMEAKKAEDLKSGRYTSKYFQEISQNHMDLKKSFEDRKRSCLQTVNDLTKSYCKELRDKDALRGEDLTPDARLLKFKLKKADYMAMLERNAGNNTMTRMILESAETAGVKLGTTYISHDSVAKSIEAAVPYAAEVATRWYNKPDVFDQVMGEGSHLAETFAED